MATAVTAVRGLLDGMGWQVFGELPPGDARPPMVFIRGAGSEILDRGMGGTYSVTAHGVDVEFVARTAADTAEMRQAGMRALDGAAAGQFQVWYDGGGLVDVDPETQTVSATDSYRVIQEAV